MGATVSLTSGNRLGPYEIVAAIGEGGMGQVYSARDTRLERSVAIKILPPSASSDPERRRRFEQEARAAGALNHPNIVVVHDIGDHDRSPYVVCELLQGATLRQLLANGPLPPRKAVDYAVQIARGLAAAHDGGIVHRDLKPENVFVTTDGRVKILDFGIAKLTERRDVIGSDATAEDAATHAGIVLGTAGYMSPEQVRGPHVDHRTDIFAFGAVLYEMLSGQRAFRRGSTVETLNAILTDEPREFSDTGSGSGPALQRVWQHCLEKNPDQRFQSARDIAFALEGTDWSGAARAVAGQGAARSAGTRLAWLIAGVFMLATATLSLLVLRRESPEVRPAVFEVTAPAGGAFQGILGISSAISPDGRSLVMVVTTRDGTRLFVRALDSTLARPLEGTDRASSPFWSPDSQWIAFFADGMLRKIRASGGASQPICRVTNSATTEPWVTGAWGADNVILFRSDDVLLRKIQADGGEATLAVPAQTKLAGMSWPSFLPDGQTFLFMTAGTAATEIRIGTLDSADTQVVLQAESRAIYASPGYLLFVREGSLMAQKFDSASKRVSGEAVMVAEDLLYFRDLGQADFSVSNDGVIAYQAGPTSSRLVWLDRDGIEIGQVGEPAHYFFPRLSPDAHKVAVDILDRRHGTTDIWYFDLTRGSAASRVTRDSRADWTPVFSPDGNSLAFASAQAGPPHVHVKSLTDSGDLQQIVAPSEIVQFVSDWVQTAEGSFVIYRDGSMMRADLMLVPVSGDRKPRPLVKTAFDEISGVAAPNGTLLAYVSNESGQNEVYLQPLHGSGRRERVSTAGGVSPRWRNDGKELFYIATASTVPFGAAAPDARLMAVAITSDGKPGVPTPLFAARSRGGQYDTRDGKRFLFNLEGVSPPLPITVDLEWTRRLRR
jgi:Tol biopolymer transport system component